MKPLNTLIVSSACLALAACSISVAERDHAYRDGEDYVSVALPNGKRDDFSCPRGTSPFVVNKQEQGDGLIYGCRTADAAVPEAGR